MAKKHISLWIDEDILKKSDANIKIAKLKNRSEFIEAAIDSITAICIIRSTRALSARL